MIRLHNNPIRYIDLQRGLPNLNSSLTPEPAVTFWMDLVKGIVLAAMMVVFVFLLFAC